MEIYKEHGKRSRGFLLESRFNMLHPYVVLLYFIGIFIFVFMFQNPVFSLTLFAVILLLMFYYKGKFSFGYLFFALIMLLITPLTVHRGSTILFYLFDNPITLEAFVYGFLNMILILTTLLSFVCFNRLIDSQKFLYVFSPIAAKTSFIVSMSLRFVPLFIKREKEIIDVQKTRKSDVPNENELDKIKSVGNTKNKHSFGKIKNVGNVFALLTDWSLEEGMQIAQSLKAKSYGVKKRTNYKLYRPVSVDYFLIFFELLLIFLLFFLKFSSLGEYNPYQNIYLPKWNFVDITGFFIMLLFIILPFIVDFTAFLKRGVKKWN